MSTFKKFVVYWAGQMALYTSVLMALIPLRCPCSMPRLYQLRLDYNKGNHSQTEVKPRSGQYDGWVLSTSHELS